MLSEFNGFYDSVLKSLSYVSGASVSDSGLMYPCDSIRKVSMIFESQWSRPIEMVFEGVTALNLRPAQDNYTSEILNASLYVKDGTVFFSNVELEQEGFNYDSTCIKAFSLRWKYL